MISKKLRQNLIGFSFLAPNMLGFFTFTFLPVLASLMLCFTDWDILTEIRYIGFSNFINLLGFHRDIVANTLVANDPLFWKYLGNTLFFVLGIPIGMTVSLALALFMNQKLKGIIVFRTIYFLPVISSLIACALVWRWIYNPDFGLLNSFLAKFGIRGPDWLSSTVWAKPALMMMGIWKGAGYNMLLYLAGLQGVPEEFYEASYIDGASERQQFFYITFPMLAPVHFFIIIMGMIGTLQIFGEAFVMTGGGPAGATTTIAYYIYNNAFQWFKMGYATTIAWVLFFLAFSVTMFQWKFLGKKVHYQ
ncbi:MAG: sugar ABC transporter permease [Candidatus Firestonebacteria bacterium]